MLMRQPGGAWCANQLRIDDWCCFGLHEACSRARHPATRQADEPAEQKIVLELLHRPISMRSDRTIEHPEQKRSQQPCRRNRRPAISRIKPVDDHAEVCSTATASAREIAIGLTLVTVPAHAADCRRWPSSTNRDLPCAVPLRLPEQVSTCVAGCAAIRIRCRLELHDFPEYQQNNESQLTTFLRTGL